MPQMEFEEPQDLNQEEIPGDPPEEEPEPEPEPEEEAPQGEEDRLAPLERAVSELVEWARGQGEQKQAPQAPPQARQRPNFGDNTVAAALWDQIEEVRAENATRWDKVERERDENTKLQTAYAGLVDQTEAYLAQRAQDGDPKLTVQDVIPIVAQMGLLKDKRIPVTHALKLAYNAAAYDAAKQSARNRGQQDVRRPDAKVPAPYRPNAQGARPQARPQTPQISAKPNSLEARTARLKREMETLDAQVGKMSPDEIQDALGG